LNEELHIKLKDRVEWKLGQHVKYLKDCRYLADQIFESTNRRLSISTIKRFFGLINSPFNPSKYTLDSLSAFLGFEDWNSYVLFHENADLTISSFKNLEDTIDKIKEITAISIQSLIEKTGYEKSRFIHRKFVHQHLAGFLNSDQPATILAAPFGYGKSSSILQFHDDHFADSESPGKNDLVCLLDGGIFFSIYSQPQYFEILRPLIEFDYKEVQELFANSAENNHDSRFVLIIDDLDKIFQNRDKYHQLIGNIMQLVMINQQNRKFKLILTCSPENLNSFSSYVRQNSILESSFYNFSFKYKDQHDVVNLPLFSVEELYAGLNLYLGSQTYYKLNLYYPEVSELLKTPIYFRYFIANKGIPTDGFSEVSFYNSIIQHFVFSQPFAEEKQILIYKLLEQNISENDIALVNKEQLLEKSGYRLAYHELIITGVICDTISSSDEPEVQITIKILNSSLFEYLLARWLLRKVNDEVKLLNSILVGHNISINFQYSLVKWLIKIAFHDKNISFLKHVHHQLERTINISNELSGDFMPGILRVIHKTFVDGLRNNDENAKNLMLWLAKFPLGQKLYFEEYLDLDNLMFLPEDSLDVYITSSQNHQGNFVSSYIRFLKGFYVSDFEKCTREFAIIAKFDFSEIDKVYLKGYYLSAYYLYASIYNNKVSKELLEQVIMSSEQLKRRNYHDYRFFIPFEIYIILNLNSCDLYEEVLILAGYWQKSRGSFDSELSFHSEFFKLCYARALLMTGSESKAIRIFNQIKKREFPFHLRQFMQMNVNLATVDFLYFQHKTADALQLLAETKVLANTMGYSFYVEKSETLEFKILNYKNDIT